jgi:hypothetical protein
MIKLCSFDLKKYKHKCYITLELFATWFSYRFGIRKGRHLLFGNGLGHFCFMLFLVRWVISSLLKLKHIYRGTSHGKIEASWCTRSILPWLFASKLAILSRASRAWTSNLLFIYLFCFIFLMLISSNLKLSIFQAWKFSIAVFVWFAFDWSHLTLQFSGNLKVSIGF